MEFLLFNEMAFPGFGFVYYGFSFNEGCAFKSGFYKVSATVGWFLNYMEFLQTASQIGPAVVRLVTKPAPPQWILAEMTLPYIFIAAIIKSHATRQSLHAQRL